jgi:hypothetical protein
MQTLHRDVFIPEIVSQTEKVAGEGVALRRYSHGILFLVTDRHEQSADFHTA